jgi:ATP-dependent DNA helicase RecG
MTMNPTQLKSVLDHLRSQPSETEVFEFKEAKHTYDFTKLGKYFSALSNEANLKGCPHAWLVFGIKDKGRAVVSTQFRPHRAELDSLKGEIANKITNRITFIEIYELQLTEGRVVMFQIPAAPLGVPIAFDGHYYGRDGEELSPLNLEEIERIRMQPARVDWSASIVPDAGLDDLDPLAIQKARENFKLKFVGLAYEIDTWDDVTFLNKSKITKKGKITNTALLLLGKNESEHFLSPAVGKISWILKDENNTERDYQHYSLPFLLSLESVYGKIRNLTYRYLLDNTLFPTEVAKYEPYIIRESLNNCVAHQDYSLGGRITLVEFPDELIFSNLGSFIPGTVEKVIQQDAPQEYYRNAFLANAMVNLKLIDTQGGGIKRMFSMQITRHFPLPSYVLSAPGRVQVKIFGKVIDENYTRLLIQKTNLDVSTIILLDKIQKHESVSKEEAAFLRQEGLVEGRYPSIHISLPIAKVTDKKAEYIRHRKFDDSYYEKLILDFIKEYGSASRQDVNRLLTGKLPEQLTEAQKLNKISNMLARMSRQEHQIKNIGSAKKPQWSILEKME